jgi:hypothetical protein
MPLRHAALALPLCLAAPPPALAERPFCGQRDEIVAALEKTYREARRAVAMQNAGVVIEIFASTETGTWTLLATRPDGVTCAMAAGEAWREEDGVVPDPPA